MYSATRQQIKGDPTERLEDVAIRITHVCGLDDRNLELIRQHSIAIDWSKLAELQFIISTTFISKMEMSGKSHKKYLKFSQVHLDQPH